ncbi:hypothetical protein FKM82_026919 [Ascaphus truei]
MRRRGFVNRGAHAQKPIVTPTHAQYSRPVPRLPDISSAGRCEGADRVPAPPPGGGEGGCASRIIAHAHKPKAASRVSAYALRRAHARH